MLRETLLQHVAASERSHRRAADALAGLRELLSKLAGVGGDGRESAESDALAAALAGFPRLSLIAWKRLCSDDPVLAYLLTAREHYRRTDERRGKDTKRLEQLALETYRKAMEHGFMGSMAQWRELLSFHGR